MHLSQKEWIIFRSNPILHSVPLPKSYEISSDIAVPNHTGIGHLGWAVPAQGRIQQIIIISSFCLQNRTNSDSNGWLHQLQPSWISTIPHTIQNWQVGWQLFLKIWVSNQPSSQGSICDQNRTPQRWNQRHYWSWVLAQKFSQVEH